MNNKYQLLPCELEENSNVKVNRASNRLSKSLSTKDRIFLNYNSNITEKEEERKVLKKENPNFIRNNQVSELISYKHGPNFRDEVLSKL